MTAQGRFITLEGIEGTGKSTSLEFLRQTFEEWGRAAVFTREPGGTPMAEEIRNVLLKPREEEVVAEAELLLVFAARAQHLHQRIIPALQRGEIVVSDRFTDATYAYQGGGRGMPFEKIEALERMVQGSFRPHLTLLLVLDPVVGLQRARRRGELDRFEREKIDFYRRVQEVYHRRAEQEPDRFVIIDASRPLDEVQESLRQAVASRLAG